MFKNNNIQKITKHLDWELNFPNEINIEKNTFSINITKEEEKEEEIVCVCDWDNGYGGRATERITLKLFELKALINKLKKS